MIIVIWINFMYPKTQMIHFSLTYKLSQTVDLLKYVNNNHTTYNRKVLK